MPRKPILVRRAPAQKVVAPSAAVKATVRAANEFEVRVEFDHRTGVVEASDFAGGAPASGDSVELTYLLESGDTHYLTARKPLDEIDIATLGRGTLVSGHVVEMNRAGLALNLGGVRGFAPASQLAKQGHDEGVPLQFQRGRLTAEVISVDHKKREVRVGLRNLVDRREVRVRGEAAARLEEGAIVSGDVVRMTSHGAFVDLGGIDGLLHESKIRRHMQESSDPVTVVVGAKLTLEVLHVDPERGRVALGFPRSDEESASWDDLAKDYQVDEHVTGMVREMSSDGCTVVLDENMVGWLPADQYDAVPSRVARGALLTAAVAGVDSAKHRIQLKANV